MNYDFIVIGGGPGGYTAAIHAAKKGKEVALIEKHKIGGTCLNWGCIPTKALLHTVEVYNAAKHSQAFGLEVKEAVVNWEQAQKNKEAIVQSLTDGVESLLEKNGVTIYKGNAAFKSEDTVEITTENGKEEIQGKKIIIAAGSEPIMIPIPGHDLEGILTSKETLELEEVPKSMAIIGGGVIGIELGYIYHSLGTEVTVIEMLPQILPREDEDLAQNLTEILEEKGMKILTDCRVSEIEKASDGFNLHYQRGGSSEELPVEKVLMAVGRKPEVAWLDSLALEMEGPGIKVDYQMKTNIPNVYAIGDVTGKYMLAHTASHQGIVAVEDALGHKMSMKGQPVPSCLYIEPEAASVGLTEKEARDQYRGEVSVSYFDLQMNGKALTIGKPLGFIKIITEKKWNEIVGVHILGPKATELIAEAVLALRLECTAEELAHTIHAHPTLSEAVMEASAGIMGEAIHALSSE